MLSPKMLFEISPKRRSDVYAPHLDRDFVLITQIYSNLLKKTVYEFRCLPPANIMHLMNSPKVNREFCFP